MPKEKKEGSTGWWELKVKMFDNSELDDNDLEHIADLVRKGFTSGQLIHDEIIILSPRRGGI